MILLFLLVIVKGLPAITNVTGGFLFYSMPQSMLFVLLSNLILLKQWASPDKIASSPQKTRVTSACLAAIIAFEN
jgi:hypothetical protein